MCAVAVSCLPPPIQANCLLSTILTMRGSSTVSPRPQTKRGRTTTVSKPSSFASRTACSAFAFDHGYGAGESGRSGAVSSTFTSGCPAIRAASVPTCTNRRTPLSREAARASRVPCTVTCSNSSGGPQSPTFAAAWNVTSAPSVPERSAAASDRSPRTGSAPASVTACDAPSDRARARALQPSRARPRRSAPPTHPAPPGTNAVAQIGLDRAVSDKARAGLADGAQVDQADAGKPLALHLVLMAEELVAAAHRQHDCAAAGRVVQRVLLRGHHVLCAQRLVAIL